MTLELIYIMMCGALGPAGPSSQKPQEDVGAAGIGVCKERRLDIRTKIIMFGSSEQVNALRRGRSIK